MENIETITTFIGWCTIVSLGVYIVTALVLSAFREPIKSIHAKLSSLSPEKLDEAYFNYLANYKLALLIFNIAPYVALKLMAS